MKACGGCKETLSDTSFGPSKQTKDGLYAWCRKCKQAKATIYRKKHSARRRQIKRQEKYKSRYGITIELFNIKLKEQYGCCANNGCSGLLKGDKQTHIDHDHKTGTFRGILCRGCNLALGLLKDDRSKILGLNDYLRSQYG